MAPKTLDELAAADDDPSLRPAEQLVAREADQVGARRQRVARRGLVLELDQHARAEVVDHRQPMCPADADELCEPGLLGEADDAEVRLVNPEQERGLGTDRMLDLEQRVIRVQEQWQLRLAESEKCITELQAELAVKEQENRELRRNNVLLTQYLMEAERERDAAQVRANKRGRTYEALTFCCARSACS